MTEAINGKIILTGFKLDPVEKSMIERIIRTYKHKIGEKIKYSEIRLRLKKSARGQTFLHEVQGVLLADKKYTSKMTDFNLLFAASEVLEKLMHGAEHNKSRKNQK